MIGTYHFLNLGFNVPFLDFSFNNNIIENATAEKILGRVIDNKVDFKKKIEKKLKKNICKMADDKFRALN